MTVLHWNKAIGRNVAFHVLRQTKSADNTVPYHGHDFAEVFWVDAGLGKHRVNEKVVPLAQGEMIFIRPSDYHGIEVSRQDSLTITNVAFPIKTLHFIHKRHFPKATRWFWSKNRLPAVLKLEPQALAEMAQIADILAAEPRRAFYIERFLMNLLYRLELQDEHPFPSPAPDWLHHACRKIETPEYLQQGVQGFVKLSGRCHEHVARVTQACLGESPSDYVNRVRMRHASQQLEMTDRPIIDIAMDCGLQNLSHFYKLFRTAHKISPRRFRMARRRLL